MVWLNSGKNYVNFSVKSYIKKCNLMSLELYIINKRIKLFRVLCIM